MFVPLHNLSMNYIDAYKLHVALGPLVVSWAFYMTVWNFSNFAGNYAHRMVLS